MKNTIFLLLLFCHNNVTGWGTDFAAAQKTAAEKNQYLLLNFSGSDWCGPCMRMRREFFETATFSSFADSSLVLVNADFPRLSKHRLPKALTLQNERLADKYNPKGRFPFTVLLKPDGTVVQSWDGLPDGDVAQFINQIKKISYGGN